MGFHRTSHIVRMIFVCNFVPRDLICTYIFQFLLSFWTNVWQTIILCCMLLVPTVCPCPTYAIPLTKASLTENQLFYTVKFHKDLFFRPTVITNAVTPKFDLNVTLRGIYVTVSWRTPELLRWTLSPTNKWTVSYKQPLTLVFRWSTN